MRDYELKSRVTNESLCSFCNEPGMLAVSSGAYTVALCLEHINTLPRIEPDAAALADSIPLP